MKILVYHGKDGDQYWLADAPERLEAAERQLFTLLDALGVYSYDDLLRAARDGDTRAIRTLLINRRCYEYEGWDIEEAIDPCTR